MKILEYLLGLLDALAPCLVPWFRAKVCKVRITTPERNEIVTRGFITVKGTFAHTLGLNFALLYHHGTSFWPQGFARLDATAKTCEKEVFISKEHKGDHYISVVTYTNDIAPLFDHYYQVGTQHKIFVPIVWDKVPPPVTFLYTTKVQTKND